MERRKLLAIVVIGMLIRIGYAVAIQNQYCLECGSYMLGAEKILLGDLSFEDSFFMVRPPLFSLLVASLGMQSIVVTSANILLGTAIIPLAWFLARQLDFVPESALIAAFIVAIDPTSVRYSAQMIAEPLANFFLVLAYICMLLLKNAGGLRHVLIWGFLGGCCIALSALTRPAAYLFWIPMALWTVFARRKLRVLAALTLIFSGMLGTGLWRLHNAHFYDNSSYSTVGTWNLLYVRAASIMYHARGGGIESVYEILARRVEARLGNDATDITEDQQWNHFLDPSAQLQSTMTDVALDVFRAYPLYYVLTIPVGLYRTLLWLDGMPLWIGTIWNAALLLLAGCGVFHLIRLRQFVEATFLLIPCVYFMTGTLLVISSWIDTRARTMFTPLLAIMAAYGVEHLLNRRRAASASLSPPADS